MLIVSKTNPIVKKIILFVDKKPISIDIMPPEKNMGAIVHGHKPKIAKAEPILPSKAEMPPERAISLTLPFFID